MSCNSIIRIAALEDEPLYLSMFRRCIEGAEGFEWAGGFSDPETFLTASQKSHADIYFLDIHLKDQLGLDCIKPLKQLHPKSRIIMLSAHDHDHFVLKAFMEGADGYLLKDASPEEIRAAIEDALADGAPMSTSIARKVIRALKKLENGSTECSPNSNSPKSDPDTKGKSNPDLPLSSREVEILDKLATGKKYLEIAQDLFIALPTVKTHIRNIYSKLQVSNKAQAILFWIGYKGGRTEKHSPF